jgi:uncharacterized membrane protein
MIELTMTVEEAFKLIISGGMVTPPLRKPKRSAAKNVLECELGKNDRND